jgi:hypothetical protein
VPRLWIPGTIPPLPHTPSWWAQGLNIYQFTPDNGRCLTYAWYSRRFRSWIYVHLKMTGCLYTDIRQNEDKITWAQWRSHLKRQWSQLLQRHVRQSVSASVPTPVFTAPKLQSSRVKIRKIQPGYELHAQ